MNTTINAHQYEGPVAWRVLVNGGATSAWASIIITQGDILVKRERAEVHLFKNTRQEAIQALHDLRAAIDKALEEALEEVSDG